MKFELSTHNVLKPLLLLGCSAFALVGQALAQGRVVDFDVPAQPATSSIPAFAREANIQILVSATDVQGKQTNAIRGNLPIHEALNQLLAGTGIVIGSDDGRTIVLAVEKNGATAERAPAAEPVPAMLAQNPVAPVAGPVARVEPFAIPVAEQVLVTGSLIHGTAAVGVPVTNLGAQDFTETGSVTISDLFRTIPAANVSPGPTAVLGPGQQERQTSVNLRGLDAGGARSLLMVDGVRFPPQSDGLNVVDPSIIPSLALDRVDVLVDGASATYGSDAISGVVNVILKRGFDGAVTQLHVGQPTDDWSGTQFQASQLWGRAWEGGDINLTYEFTHEDHIPGTVHSNYTINYTPWGLDNRIPLGSALPGIISTGAPSATLGTGCANCYAIPHGTGANFNASLNAGLGPLTSQSAPTLNWSSLTAGTVAQNQVNPLTLGWERASQEKNSFVATIDQRLFQGVSFFGTGFYSNRRVDELVQPANSSGTNNDIKTYAVPTTNPYYPTGAPNGLRVSYDLAAEAPTTDPAFEIAWRYEGGLNLELPFDWSGQLYYSHSYDGNDFQLHELNANAISIALGNTVGGISKPSGIPYLNLFCDPAAFTCNSQATFNYARAVRETGDKYQISERGARFDGPLFDIPGGQIKAAVGGLYQSDDLLGWNGRNDNTPAGTPLQLNYDSEPYNVWAGFAQIDVPLFGDNFNLPLVRKLDVEGSFRYDSYNGTLQGSTTNPKVAFTWLIDELVGATVRGSWGTSFRFANAGEYSVVLSDQNTGESLPGDASIVPLACGPGNTPTAGSAVGTLVAAGFACGSTPGGINWGGGRFALRSFTNAATGQAQTREGGPFIGPEQATNYSIGFEFAPQFDLLRGLDVQATWYSIKLNNVISSSFGTVSSQTLSDPNQRFHIIFPSDLGCPVTANANPTSCAPFEKMVTAAITDFGSAEPLSNASLVYWISDGGAVNAGFQHLTGVDWNASYNIDLGDFGAWNTGITGTYYLHNWIQPVPGGTILDELHQNIQPAGGVLQNGVETTPRMVYRARLGWSDGAFSVTGFMNYQSHYFSPWAVPPNVNFQCTGPGGTQGGGTYPCAISNFSNVEPSWYTFDLSLGYNTGDTPAIDYLKRINVQIVIQDILDKHSPFQYGGSVTAGRGFAAYDVLKPNTGRLVGITIVKTW